MEDKKQNRDSRIRVPEGPPVTQEEIDLFLDRLAAIMVDQAIWMVRQQREKEQNETASTPEPGSSTSNPEAEL